MGAALEIRTVKLDITTLNTTTGQRFFKYRAVKCWNMLPEEITKCESLHCFKSEAKRLGFCTQLFNEYIYLFFILVYTTQVNMLFAGANWLARR